jgi:hypothetical protein
MSEQAVYWYVDKDGKYYSSNEVKLFMDSDTKTLYLEPPQWFLDKHNLIPLSVPTPIKRTLADEKIDELWHQSGGLHHHFARAVERYLKGEE